MFLVVIEVTAYLIFVKEVGGDGCGGGLPGFHALYSIHDRTKARIRPIQLFGGEGHGDKNWLVPRSISCRIFYSSI